MRCHTIITIARQYGSGGREIGRRLAEKLDIPYYDKELLAIASQNSGLCQELFEQRDEKPTNSLLYSLVMGTPWRVSGADALTADLPLNHKIFLAQFETIERIASQGGCVIVGRCADYVLREHGNCLHVFLHAPMSARIERAVSMYGLSPDKAEKQIRQLDKQRESYYNYFTTQKWGEFENYDLAVNTDKLGYDATVQLLEACALRLQEG